MRSAEAAVADSPTELTGYVALMKGKTMKLVETSEYDEEEGPCLFVSFSRDDEGNILGEPPEVYFGSGYLEEDFDDEKWTHFIRGENFNFLFTHADSVNFPSINQAT